MNIVFLGTPDFAIPALSALSASYPPRLVITAPEDPKKGLSPVHRWALDHAIKVEAPERLHPELFGTEPIDLFIIVAYGKILPKNILSIPIHGALNIHPSLLPHHRGAAPIQSAILAGDKETGVTIMVPDEKVDHGPILAQTRIPLTEKTDGITLSKELAEVGATLLLATIPRFISGDIKPVEQEHANATFTKLLKKEDGKILWDQPAEIIERMIRAYLLWPTAWTAVGSLRIKILSAHIGEKTSASPGTPLKPSRHEFAIAAKDRVIVIDILQPEGKQPMTGEAFLNGYGAKIF